MRVILKPADWTQQKVNHDVVLARKSPLQVLDEARSVSTSSWNRDVTRSWGSRALIPSICHANREAGPDNEGRNNHRACLGSQAIWTLTMIEEGGATLYQFRGGPSRTAPVRLHGTISLARLRSRAWPSVQVDSIQVNVVYKVLPSPGFMVCHHHRPPCCPLVNSSPLVGLFPPVLMFSPSVGLSPRSQKKKKIGSCQTPRVVQRSLPIMKPDVTCYDSLVSIY